MKRLKARKVLNMDATLERYSIRLSNRLDDYSDFHMPGSPFYLTDFGVNKLDSEGVLVKSHARVMEGLLRARGIPVLGCINANKHNGAYIEALPNGAKRIDEGGDVYTMYVGAKNALQHQEASEWSILKQDKVYCE